MRTTLDLPDPLFRELKAGAALRGMKMKDLLYELIAAGLREPGPALARFNAILGRMQPESVDTGGGATVGGNVIAGTFVGRDQIINNFTGRYARLRDLYRSPDHIFADVDVANFVGRENIKRAIDEFLQSNDSGAFIIEGEAGLGKTALLAHLAYARGYPHLFGQDFSGVDGRVEAARSLAAQLISKYELEGYGEAIDADQAASATFLTHVFNQAARGLTDGQKIVVVVDALDQAAPPTDGRNVFGLPSRLPRGAYLIVTQRPVRAAFECEPSELFALKADDADNQRDLGAFLARQARHPRIAEQLARHQPPYRAEAFVEKLVEKSGGNWMYLRYVLGELRRGNTRPLDLDALPRGLTQYYLSYWRKWTDGTLGAGRAAWRDAYGPALGLLAAAQAPLGIEALLDWGDLRSVTDADQLRELLAVEWAAYVSHMPGETFQFFHPSLARLMRGEAEPGEGAGLRREEQELMRTFARCTADAHRRIAEHFRKRCGGEWVKLVADPYPRRFIVAHLRQVDPGVMVALVAMSDAWARAREAADDGYAGYLGDLAIAWAWADAGAWSRLGQQLRCALIESSIRTLSGGIKPVLLRQIAIENLWSRARALDFATQAPADEARSRGIVELFPHLPAGLRAEAFEAVLAVKEESSLAHALRALAAHLDPQQRAQALAAALAIKDGSSKAMALGGLAAHLDPEQRAQALAAALAAALAIRNGHNQANALRGLAGHLDPEQRAQAFAAALAIPHELSKADALGGLAAHLDPEQRAVALAAALAINDEVSRAAALCGLVAYLDPEQRATAIDEAPATALEIQDEPSQIDALRGLVAHLDPRQRAQAFRAALALKSEPIRSAALYDLAPYLDPEQRATALAAALAMRHEPSKAQALGALAEHLGPKQRAQALAAALAIRDGPSKVRALSAMIEHLDSEQRSIAFDEALAAALTTHSEVNGVQALSDLAGHLEPQQRDLALSEAMAAALAIRDKSRRADALSDLAEHLDPQQRRIALSAALAAALAIQDEASTSGALRELAEPIDPQRRASALTTAPPAPPALEQGHTSADAAPRDPEQRAEALAAALAARDDYSKASALSALAEHLDPQQRAQALDAALAIRTEINRAQALRGLAGHLDPRQRARAFSAALAMRDETALAYALGGLAEHLDPEQRAQALAAALAIQEASARAYAFSAMPQSLSPQQRTWLILAILRAPVLLRMFDAGFNTGVERSIALSASAGFPGLTAEEFSSALHALGRAERGLCADVLATLAPLLRHFGGQATLDELVSAINDVARWWP